MAKRSGDTALACGLTFAPRRPCKSGVVTRLCGFCHTHSKTLARSPETNPLDIVLNAQSLTTPAMLNLADLLDSMPRGEPVEPAPPPATPRVLLQHAVVRRGLVSFTDLSGRTPQTVALEPIDVELHNITTIPERRGPYAIAATLAGGGVVGWEGEVSLVPLRSAGRFGILGFPLATAWRFVQDEVALAEPAGRVDADVRYRFARQDGAN